MTAVGPQINLNLKFSESFWTRLACAIAGHSWKDQYIRGPLRPDGRRVYSPTPVCNRCGKFKNFPFTWKDYWKKPGILFHVE